MPQTAPSSYVFHRAFDDFDALCQDVRQWDLDFRQIERGRFHGEILQFGCGPVHISEALFGRRLLQRGAPPTGLRTIGVPASSDVRIQWRGSTCGGNDLMVFSDGAELDSVSDGNFHVYACSFPAALLGSISEQFGLAELDELRKGNEVIRCAPESISRLRQLLSNLANSLRADCAALEQRQTVRDLTRELPRQLLCAIDESENARVSSTSKRRELALQRALEFIELWGHEAITVREICDSAGVSQRTLEYAFHERFGVTPKSFLLSYRLNMVRKQLRDSVPGRIQVSDVANHWGFWHMGQFAADYRAFFAELPSETLRNIV